MLVIGAIAGSLYLGYQWTQTFYYVGADEDSVVIYQGVQQSVGPFRLSQPYNDTDIMLADLTDFDRSRVEATLGARSLSDAEAIVDRLRASAEANQ